MLGFPVSLVPRPSLGTRLAMPAGWSIFRVRDRRHALSLEKFSCVCVWMGSTSQHLVLWNGKSLVSRSQSGVGDKYLHTTEF